MAGLTTILHGRSLEQLVDSSQLVPGTRSKHNSLDSAALTSEYSTGSAPSVGALVYSVEYVVECLEVLRGARPAGGVAAYADGWHCSIQDAALPGIEASPSSNP